MPLKPNNSKVYFIEIKVRNRLKFSFGHEQDLLSDFQLTLTLRLKHNVNNAFVFHNYTVSYIGNPAKDSASRQSKFFSR